jgi:drug/metabolite transporter (DMT)-like permease
VGAYLVSFPNLTVNLNTGKGTLVAALYAAGAAAAWGVGTAFSKYALKGTSYPHVTAARFGLTAIISLCFVLGTGSAAAVSQITQTQFFYLLAITFSTGLVALLIYYYGLQRVAASRAAILELAWPLSAVLIGWLFLRQGLTITQALGALTLLATAGSAFADFVPGRVRPGQRAEMKTVRSSGIFASVEGAVATINYADGKAEPVSRTLLSDTVNGSFTATMFCSRFMSAQV